jgi:hypothetical protein
MTDNATISELIENAHEHLQAVRQRLLHMPDKHELPAVRVGLDTVDADLALLAKLLQKENRG